MVNTSFMKKQYIDSDYSKNAFLLFVAIITLGLILRLWGLGGFSLRGDEEIMALASLGILESGSPVMPSGLYYPRALGQLYLIAISMKIFGNSEWAVRLPSVLVGVSGLAAAYFLGRRFLSSGWNLLFVLILAVNPWMIELSQTARMYIFFSSSLMLFAVMVLHWEKKGDWTSLFLAFLAFLLSLHFHQLAIFFSFLFFFPLLTQPSRRRFVQSSFAFFSAVFSFLFYKKWISAQYGAISGDQTQNVADAIGLFDKFLFPFKHLITQHPWAISSLLVLCLLVVAILFFSTKPKNASYIAANAFLLGTIGASFLLKYHVAFLFFVCAVILFLRARGRKSHLFILTLSLSLLFLGQLYLLYSAKIFPSAKQLIMALIDTPSVFPYIVLFEELTFGFLLLALLVLFTAKDIASGAKVPDYFLFFAVSVLLPVLSMGLFRYYFPPRLLFPVVPLFILCSVAGFLYFRQARRVNGREHDFKYAVVAALVIGLLFIRPFKLEISTNEIYKRFPDHSGAAAMIKRVNPKSQDVVLAEDVLQQTYYLGKVDFWLRGYDVAKSYVREKQGALRNIYTDVPLMGTGEELEHLIQSKDRGAIYIIGSGETTGNYAYFLSNGIWDVLKRYSPEIIFTGRDNQTVIWHFPPPN